MVLFVNGKACAFCIIISFLIELRSYSYAQKCIFYSMMASKTLIIMVCSVHFVTFIHTHALKRLNHAATNAVEFVYSNEGVSEQVKE